MIRLNRERLGQLLLAARTKHQLTTRALQVVTGISAATISRAERGHPDVCASAETVLVLCHFFRIDPMDALETTFPAGQMFHGKTPMKQNVRQG